MGESNIFLGLLVAKDRKHLLELWLVRTAATDGAPVLFKLTQQAGELLRD